MNATLHHFSQTQSIKSKSEDFEKLISFLLAYDVPIELDQLKNCRAGNLHVYNNSKLLSGFPEKKRLHVQFLNIFRSSLFKVIYIKKDTFV